MGIPQIVIIIAIGILAIFGVDSLAETLLERVQTPTPAVSVGTVEPTDTPSPPTIPPTEPPPVESSDTPLSIEQIRNQEILLAVESLIKALTGENLDPSWITWVTEEYEENLLKMYNKSSNVLRDHFANRTIAVEAPTITLDEPEQERAHVDLVLAETIGEDVIRCTFKFIVDYKEGVNAWLVESDLYLSTPGIPSADPNCY